jgi:hypothetical protein
MECAYYVGGRHMECAYYFGGRHMECAYYFDFCWLLYLYLFQFGAVNSSSIDKPVNMNVVFQAFDLNMT